MLRVGKRAQKVLVPPLPNGMNDPEMCIEETYRLDHSKLLTILGKIGSESTAGRAAPFILRENGIYIFGNYPMPSGAKLNGYMARLIDGTFIGKDPSSLYLQIFEQDGLSGKGAEPNLLKLLREFIV